MAGMVVPLDYVEILEVRWELFPFEPTVKQESKPHTGAAKGIKGNLISILAKERVENWSFRDKIIVKPQREFFSQFVLYNKRQL